MKVLTTIGAKGEPTRYSINLIIKFIEDPTLKHEASLQRFLRKLKKKTLTKMNMINCILLFLLLLVPMVLLKCTNFSLVIHFLNFVGLFHLKGSFDYNLARFLCEYNLNKPKFHLRYFDDILTAFDKEQLNWK